MKREFVVVEIFLDRVSGEARGTATLDSFSGLVENVEYTAFNFYNDRDQSPVTLTQDQQGCVENIVERVFEFDSEFSENFGVFTASAEILNGNSSQQTSKRTLAGFLANVARRVRDGIKSPLKTKARSAGVKRFG